MAYTIPPTRGAGDSGHLSDHVNVNSILTSLGKFNVLNTAFAGGADPTGTNDCTAAFQACLDAILANGGGNMYIPTGDYKMNSSVTYTGAGKSLRIHGDGPQNTRIHGNSSGACAYFDITAPNNEVTELAGDGVILIDGLSYHHDVDATAATTLNVFIRMTHVMYGQISNVATYRGTATNRMNQAIVLQNCKYVDVENCMLYVRVNGVANTASGTDKSEVCHIRQTTIWQTDNGGNVATAAGILAYGQVLTLHAMECVFHHGPRGIYLAGDGTYGPHLLFAYDCEVNNHTIAGMEFEDGLRVYLQQCNFSAGNIATGPGALFDSTFEGAVYMNECNFIGADGHTIDIEGGAGYNITACELGGNGMYKTAANTYDEIHIGGTTTAVTIDSCHFNVDGNTGMGTSNPPRSAVYVESGVTKVSLTNSKGAGTGYGTSPVVDLSNGLL